MRSFFFRVTSGFLTVSIVFIVSAGALAQKMTVEDIVSRHRSSIGSEERFVGLKNRLAIGLSEFESKLPAKKANGKAVIASQGNDLMFLVSLNSNEYPFEKIGFFGDKVSLPWVTSGTRSPLGAFIADHEKILSDGLFTGSISSAWALLDPSMKNAKVMSGGRKKVAGRETYVLEYFPKGVGSSDFSVRIFIDAETFHHLRTEYKHSISSSQDKFGQLGRQAGLKLSLTETFGDFKTVDGLTFPYSYRAEYLTDSNSGVYEYIWTVKVQQYLLNQQLDPNFFTFDKKS